MFLPQKYDHLEKLFSDYRHFLMGNVMTEAMARLLGQLDGELVKMSLPEGDRKKLIDGLIKDIQADIDKDIIDNLHKIVGGQPQEKKLHTVNPLAKEIELTHDFPLFIGVTGRGPIMKAVNLAYEEQRDRVLDNIIHAIDEWVMKMPHEMKFSVTVDLPTGSKRSFDCLWSEVMVRSIGSLMGTSHNHKKTPFQVRLRIKTAIPDYLEQIDQIGHFYLTGYADIDSSDNGGGMLFTVKGLGYTMERYDGANMNPVFTNNQLLLGEDS